MSTAVALPMTEREFGTIFAKLALRLRFTDADAAVIREYREALQGYAFEALQRSADALSREPGRRFFPTTAEWSDAARTATEQLLREHVRHPRDKPWEDECPRCGDTGWEGVHDEKAALYCPGDETCGRKTAHARHSYTRACPCRATNRTYLRHQKFGSGVA